MVKNDYFRKNRGRNFVGEYPTLQEVLDITVSEHGDRTCFVCHKPVERRMTFSEVKEEVARIGSFLIGSGVRKGDRIALNGKNSIQWALCYLSASYAGAVIVPIDNMMEAGRVRPLIDFAGASVFFADSDVLAKVDVAGLKCFPLEEIEGLGSPVYPRENVLPDDTLSMLFTSGTTGNEKCVVLSHKNIISNAFMACDSFFFKLGPADVMFALLPLHHAYCCTAVLIETVLNGNSCLFGQGMTPAKIIGDLRQGKVTFMMGIPLIYNKFLAGTFKKVREKGLLAFWFIRVLMFLNGLSRKVLHINFGRRWFRPILENLGMMNLRVCICGAGPLSPKVFRAFQQLGIDFVQGYGLTETSPILTLNPIRHFKVKSVGKVFADVEGKILNPDLLGVGEFVVRGPNVCKGYYKDEKATAELFTEDGFLKTGDIGVLDRKNYLYLRGRARNIIVTEGGKNVFPEEIEEHFELHPEIGQILVRGFVSDRGTRSEQLEAVVYPSPEFFGNTPEGEVQSQVGKVVADVNSKLISYKKIARFSISRQPMSMTTTKKIQRSKVARTFDNIIKLI